MVYSSMKPWQVFGHLASMFSVTIEHLPNTSARCAAYRCEQPASDQFAVNVGNATFVEPVCAQHAGAAHVASGLLAEASTRAQNGARDELAAQQAPQSS